MVGHSGNSLLRVRGQLTGLLRFLAQSLDGVHNFRLLGKKRVAEISGPGDVGIELLYDVGKDHQSLHAGVPILLLRSLRKGGAGETGIVLQPLVGLNHFQRISGRYHDLGKQRIGIQRNRRHQIFQLLCIEGLIRRW